MKGKCFLRPPKMRGLHQFLLILCACLVCFERASSSDSEAALEDRIRKAKLDLWLHGAFEFDGTSNTSAADNAADLEMQAARAPIRHGHIREVRQRLQRDLGLDETSGWSTLMDNVFGMRGGDQLAELSAKFGKPFIDAIEQNKAEHAADCARSCEVFYCAADDSTNIKWDAAAHPDTTIASYSFGSVPPEDFSDEFK